MNGRLLRLLLPALTALALLSGCVAVRQGEFILDRAPWYDYFTRITFPSKLGPLVKTGEYEYQPADYYGRAVVYELPGKPLRIEVSLYKLGLGNIPDDIDSPVVRAHFLDLCEEFISQDPKQYQHLVMVDLGGGICVMDHSKVEYHRAEFSWQETDIKGKVTLRNGHLLLTTCRGNFLKIRGDYPRNEENEMLPVFRDFARNLGETILSSRKRDPDK